MKKVIAIIQARMGSTRLPGKVMKDLCGYPVLWHVLERVKQAGLLDDIVIATSTEKSDDVLVKYLESISVKYYRGSEDDVLGRYYEASKVYPSEAIVRITSDCPLIDPYIIDRVVQYYLENDYAYVSNGSETEEGRTFPRGLDCEIFSRKLLEQAFNEGVESYEREHVTPFMYWKQQNLSYVKNNNNYSDMRWTLDTAEDFELITAVYRHFYKNKHDFYMEDIIGFIRSNPSVYLLNHHVKQKETKPINKLD